MSARNFLSLGLTFPSPFACNWLFLFPLFYSYILTYYIYFTYTSHHFTPHGRYKLNKLTSLAMCGFIAQLVEQRTGNAEVTGSNPVEALIFSGFFFPVALQNLLRWSFFTFSDSITWVFLCIYIIHPMQGHLDFSRSGIAWNWTGADIFVSFLFRQMPELTFLRMLNFFF